MVCPFSVILFQHQFSPELTLIMLCFFFIVVVVVVLVLNLFEFNVRGFVRFVNIRDGKGATPLHLAARQRRPECVHILLDCGALVCASTGRYG